jgi:hypothetical protein
MSATDPVIADPACAEAWQDGLDLLAVVAGLKPVCLVGRGAGDEAWCATLRTAANGAALTVIEDAPWEPEGDLPKWYLEATARRRARSKVLYICRDDAIAAQVKTLSAQGRISVDAEARLLGYPCCCVAQHHARTLAYEHLLAQRTERLTRGDQARMMRLVEAGVEPMPATRAEWDEVVALTRIAPAPGTSVNMCDACARDPASPAMRLAADYARLAWRLRYPAL